MRLPCCRLRNEVAVSKQADAEKAVEAEHAKRTILELQTSEAAAREEVEQERRHADRELTRLRDEVKTLRAELERVRHERQDEVSRARQEVCCHCVDVGGERWLTTAP